jgi:hypothetical protein
MSAAPEIDLYETAVDVIVAQCGGDARGAVKALLCANELLEADLQRALRAASAGVCAAIRESENAYQS